MVKKLPQYLLSTYWYNYFDDRFVYRLLQALHHNIFASHTIVFLPFQISTGACHTLYPAALIKPSKFGSVAKSVAILVTLTHR